MMRRPGRFFGQAFLAAACFALALGVGLFGRDDDPREITIVQPDGTQETYILIGVGTTSYEGYNFPKDMSNHSFLLQHLPIAQGLVYHNQSN